MCYTHVHDFVTQTANIMCRLCTVSYRGIPRMMLINK